MIKEAKMSDEDQKILIEADTCRKYVAPGLVQAGWDDEPHSFTEQATITDGRIIVVGDKPTRRKPKRSDYLLRYTRDIKLAVVEAKRKYMKPGDGLQQAKLRARKRDGVASIFGGVERLRDAVNQLQTLLYAT